MHSSYHTGKQFDAVMGFEIIAFFVSLVLIIIFPSYFAYKLYVLWGVFFLAFGGAVLSFLLLLFLNQSKRLAKDITKFHQGVIGQSVRFKYLLYPVLVSVPEELLFRLVIPSVIVVLLPTWPWSVFLASLLFGAVHIRKGISFLVPITAFIIGVIFALVYELSGKNILAPIGAHLIFTILRVYKFAK